MNIIKRIVAALYYGDEIALFCKEKRAQREEEEREASKYHLNLCKKHQQEQNHSHFAEGNCDYCRLGHKYAELKKANFETQKALKRAQRRMNGSAPEEENP